ncbi:MAG: HAD-IIB family hydrolase [Clostridia bacterium]|nr:HAD-IIB family hydrolase [Clostridia bacterium]
MGKFEGILICSDFDGTFANASVISEKNAEAVRHFQREGGLFTLSTGRSHHHFASYNDIFVPNAPMLCYNGSVMYDPATDTTLYEGHMEPSIYEDLPTILALAPEIVDLTFCGNGKDFHMKAADYAPAKAKEGMPPDQLLKVLTRMESENSDEVTARVQKAFSDRYGIYRSWYYGIEIQSFKDTKGQGVLRLKHYLGDRVKTVIACGDYENDLPMFEVADISYAPSSAHPGVKARATRITVACHEDAIAQVIADLDREIS